MAADLRISVQTGEFDPGAETLALHRGARETGAVATFMGLVRDMPGDPLHSMTLEHYPGMTEKALQQIALQAGERWPLGRITVIHRVGTLQPLDPIVFVGVSSAHREAAFAACQFIMDYLKRDAPFWKKERSSSGDRWVEQKESDRLKAKSWDH
ncbi:molybdopterin synthase catalytic subunit MoaE [Motiliproteus sediminis]|uniref:molybdopterin synthase catalytic subunit MoaE n=1 Tax=Motiliproteus sediminis TaxID=1468178 RepID=UPI001AEF38E8|nr:molybdopterin synthase catalytic subunit MoaE [Motiliproteus sediminis]